MPEKEYWDLYDRKRRPLGKKVIRDPNGHTQIPPLAYHLVVECVIVDMERQILLTQRALGVKHHAGFWECTTGSVLAGEDSRTGVHREVLEETGLDIPLDKFNLLKTIVTDVVIRDIYVVCIDKIKLEDIRVREGETSAATALPFTTFLGISGSACIAPDGTFMRLRGPQVSRLLQSFDLIEKAVAKSEKKKPGRKKKKPEAEAPQCPAATFAECSIEDLLALSAGASVSRKEGV